MNPDIPEYSTLDLSLEEQVATVTLNRPDKANSMNLAEEARKVGFLNRVFPDRETLLQEVQAIARTIASRSPLAIHGSKEMLLYTRDHSVADGLNHVATWNAGMLSYTDLQAGLQAQVEKRQAVYED